MVAVGNNAGFRLVSADPVAIETFASQSPVIALHDYWRRIAPRPGRLPGRQHLDPLDIDRAVIPWIFMMDVIRADDAPLDFRFRLVGTGNSALVGRDATGQLASAIFNQADTQPVLDTYVLTVGTAAPTYWIATVPQDRVGTVTIHRGLFPLARDGQTVDMLLCVAAPWPSA